MYAINGDGKPVSHLGFPVSADKIVLNHYHCRSREEYLIKRKRGYAAHIPGEHYTDNEFNIFDRNDEFDDGILKHRAVRAQNFSMESGTEKISRVTEALVETLAAYSSGEALGLETALTCRALSGYLREHFPNDADYWAICEEKSLDAVLKSVRGMNIADAQLLIRELPNMLGLPYPAARALREVAIKIIPQLMDAMRLSAMWKDFAELDYIRELLMAKE